MYKPETFKVLTEGADSVEEHVSAYQVLIDSGDAWLLEGSVGREAQRLIDEGYCTLGPVGVSDYYSSYVPSRYEVPPGTVGSAEYVETMSEQRVMH